MIREGSEIETKSSSNYQEMRGIDYCNATEVANLNLLFPTERDLDIRPLYTYLCPVIIVICFFSIIFNAILISISRQSKVVNKSQVVLLSLNLAITDLIAALFNGLGILFNSYLPEVYSIKMGQCSMLMFEVVRSSALVASALHLLALACVHYRGIVKPLHYR